jgi:hypothetical protein
MEYLRTEAIEIDGVVEALAELSKYVRMAIVTTAKRADFEIIHEKRHIRKFMDFVLETLIELRDIILKVTRRGHLPVSRPLVSRRCGRAPRRSPR